MKIELLSEVPNAIDDAVEMIYEEFVIKTKSSATKSTIKKFLTCGQDFPITFVAVADEKNVGTISIFENDYKARLQYKPWLASLVVRENYRKYGIGTKLIKAVVDKAGELGYPEIYLKTETAAGYYDKLGWQRVERVVGDDGIESWIFKKSAKKTLQNQKG